MARAERKSLLETFLARVRRTPVVTPMPASAPRPFQAISIYHGVKCCALAKRFSEHRFLAKDAPQLPLAGCPMANTCQCCYLKHKDRRADRRRFMEFGAASRSFMGQDRRLRSGRRAND